MQNKLSVTVIFMLFFQILAFAQDNRPDVIYLKNGSRIKGTIINFIPGEMILINADGREIEIDAADIRRVINNGDKRDETRVNDPIPAPADTTDIGATYDVVNLKDGSILRGEITDLQQDEYVVIVSGNREFKLEYADIKRIRTELKKSPARNYTPEPREIIDPATLIIKGWSNTTYFTAAYGKSLIEDASVAPGLHSVTVKQMSRKVGVGFGVGIDGYLAERGETVYPVYGVYRMYPFDKHREYYLGAGLGYGFAFKNNAKNILKARGGIYAEPSIGFRSSSKDGTSLNIEIGYRLQDAYFEEQSEFTENDLQIRDVNYRRLVVRVGLMFWEKSSRKGVKMKKL